jgi:hypothetical protein
LDPIRRTAGSSEHDMRSRKRCRFCRCLFTPDGRVALRQWACTKTECQARRRQHSQAQWRKEHPEDPVARRLRADLARAKADGKAPSPPPAPRQIPWDELRDEISPELLVILALFVRLGIRATRDEIRRQVVVSTPVSGDSLGGAPKDERAFPKGLAIPCKVPTGVAL